MHTSKRLDSSFRFFFCPKNIDESNSFWYRMDMNTDDPFQCDFEEFKKISAKFIDRMKDKTLSEESVYEAKRAYVFHYLHLKEADENNRYQAQILFTRIGLRAYEDRMMEIELDRATAVPGEGMILYDNVTA